MTTARSWAGERRLREGTERRPPTSDRTTAHGGTPAVEAREVTARVDFQARAEHPDVQAEDQPEEGRTVPRGVTEDQVPGPGGGRNVRDDAWGARRAVINLRHVPV